MSGDRWYFEVRRGWRWQVFYCYTDGYTDPHSGAVQWQASSVRHWRKIDAMREATALLTAYEDGRAAELVHQLLDSPGPVVAMKAQ